VIVTHLGRGEQSTDGRVQFGCRIGFARGGKEEARIVDETLTPFPPWAVEEQDVPGPLPAQLQPLGLFRQLLLIVCGGGCSNGPEATRQATKKVYEAQGSVYL